MKPRTYRLELFLETHRQLLQQEHDQRGTKFDLQQVEHLRQLSSRPMSEETKAKIAKARKGRKHSAATRKKIGQAMRVVAHNTGRAQNRAAEKALLVKPVYRTPQD